MVLWNCFHWDREGLWVTRMSQRAVEHDEFHHRLYGLRREEGLEGRKMVVEVVVKILRSVEV